MSRIKQILCLFLSSITIGAYSQNWIITEMSEMPKSISNNAVVEARVSQKDYLFSFGGIDSTKKYSGISNESFKYDVENDLWSTISPLPDTSNKIAAAASFVNGKIYIIGGYSVYADGSEVSSDKVHRFDPETNTYLSDGTAIPIPIDDHVQAVYKDSLIFVVTGWSNTRNVSDVQIYDTYQNSWSVGARLPRSFYQVFGSSGAILGDTIYYLGGASGSFNFPASERFNKGYINPNNPTQISWESSFPTNIVKSYRAASTKVKNQIVWIGGSQKTYNYDGLAYDNGSGVAISNHIVSYYINSDSLSIFSESSYTIPMDLRGVASINDTVKYIAGGMLENQKVSNKTYKLEYKLLTSLSEQRDAKGIKVFPNPFHEQLNFSVEETKDISIKIYDVKGQLVFQTSSKKADLVNTIEWKKGIYILVYSDGFTQKSMKLIRY